MSFKKGNLYTNEAKTEGIYPNTVYSAIYKDDMSKTLDADLGDLSHYNAQTITSGVDPLYLHLDMDLLWENASPTSTFATQTINLNLSSYKLVCIYLKFYTDLDGCGFNILPVPITNVGVSALTSGTDTYLRYRMVNVSTTGISFGVGRNSSDTSTNNDRAIPLQIYGIK
jgi:hypothetical protein